MMAMDAAEGIGCCRTGHDRHGRRDYGDNLLADAVFHHRGRNGPGNGGRLDGRLSFFNGRGRLLGGFAPADDLAEEEENKGQQDQDGKNDHQADENGHTGTGEPLTDRFGKEGEW